MKMKEMTDGGNFCWCKLKYSAIMAWQNHDMTKDIL